MLWKPTKKYEDAAERLNRTMKYQADNYAYFICLKSNDEPIGFAGIKEKEKHRSRKEKKASKLNDQDEEVQKLGDEEGNIENEDEEHRLAKKARK